MPRKSLDPDLSDEELEEYYAEWWQNFTNVTYQLLETTHIFSPTWETLWYETWSDYDALEALSKERRMAQRSWQGAWESYRSRTEAFRQYISGPMLESDWAFCPLGLKLEHFLGTEVVNSNGDWAVALERAKLFQDLVNTQVAFKKCLSTSQKVSWTLLEEWWLAKYQDSNLTKAAIASLEVAAASPPTPKRFRDQPSPEAEKSSLIKKSVYHAVLFDLFKREFNPRMWQPYCKDVYLASLRRVRTQSLAYASAQRLGYAAYSTIQTLSVPEPTPYIGSILDSCSWLPPRSVDPGMPFFLWDVNQMCTVITAELGGRPDYCCVSHTWGRWRKEPPAQVAGVPWLVPQNHRFNVQDLPNYLKVVRPRFQYVWIDLFCIPQDGSPKADEEINRQATIFQTASRCLAWHNDVLDWSVTKSALSWLGLSFLQTTSSPEVYDINSNLQRMHEEVQSCGELFPSQNNQDNSEVLPTVLAQGDRVEKAYEEPASWFSSLWTLQEAMLCPGMFLVARHWIQLTDASGVAIPFNTLFNVVNLLHKVWNKGLPYKPGPNPISDHSDQLLAAPDYDHFLTSNGLGLQDSS